MLSVTVAGVVLVLSAALVCPGRARACSLAGAPAHTIDPAMVGVDQAPPQLAQPGGVEVKDLDQGGGCGGCGWQHSATIAVLATDDMTPGNRIGYRVTTVVGTEPLVNDWVRGAILAGPDGKLSILWNGDSNFDFTVQLIAVDAAGNESAPQNVRIHDDAGGCSVGRRRASGEFTAGLVALALASAAARRARRRHCDLPDQPGRHL